MTTPRARRFLAMVVVSISVAACSNPEREKVEHVKKGDQYVADKKDEFAVVEYASAIQIDARYGEAHWKLAQTYERMGNVRAALPTYIRAADALPNDYSAQVKATELLLLARRFDDAKARASALLAKNPTDVDARLLKANATAGAGDAAGAIALIQEVLKVDSKNSSALVTLGAIRQQMGQLKEAESALREAIDSAPASAGARVALASLLAGQQRGAEAEKVLQEALAKEPKNLFANRMLAELYMATNRTSEAERPLKVIVEASADSQPRFQLASYYVAAGRIQDATDLFTALSKDPTTFAEAESRLAALEYSQKKPAEAHKRLDALLVRIPNYPLALTMRAEWLLQENKLDAALESAKAATAADPNSAAAHMVLAAAHDLRRESAAAARSYTEVLRLNPRAPGARAALSRLNLELGEKEDALRLAEEAKRTEPASLQTRVALVRSLMTNGDLERAEKEIGELLKGAPKAPVVHTLQGILYATRHKTSEARRSFERALQISPGFSEAVTRLSALDVQADAPTAAIARLEEEIAKQPNNAALLVSVARAYAGVKDYAKAEDRLRRAVVADPRLTVAYSELAQLYIQQKKLDQARAEFEAWAKRDPSAMGPPTMVGILLEVQGRRDDARKVYEDVVGRSGDAPVAANNLAYLYAEQGTNLDIALQLATSAKPKLPDNPSVDDTIGWVYYKKDLASLAVKPLQESAKKLPNNPEVLYHLGLAYAKVGDKAKARDALSRARALDPRIGGAEAERVLASVLR